jgi:hypothetical protein
VLLPVIREIIYLSLTSHHPTLFAFFPDDINEEFAKVAKAKP